LPKNFDEVKFDDKKRKLKALKFKQKQINKANSQKSMEERKAEKAAQANKKWSMIKTIEVYFMLYACFDFFC
jgi:hypothetical protein